jgi:heme A synthase
MTATTSRPAPEPATTPVRRRTALTLAGATLAPALPWLLSQATGTDLEVSMKGQDPLTIGLPLILITALTASLAGWGALAALRRLTRHGRGAWSGLAVAALLGSFTPVALADTGTAARVYLALMHVAVAAVLVPGLRGTAAAERDA